MLVYFKEKVSQKANGHACAKQKVSQEANGHACAKHKVSHQIASRG